MSRWLTGPVSCPSCHQTFRDDWQLHCHSAVPETSTCRRYIAPPADTRSVGPSEQDQLW